mmetsp:Transcript_10850/g.10973  ORF Transcript_10850/g.10973 Transcript_10850/m.10973 type:complete len:96 (+) Transcript_10850:839-1126(+)
MPEGHDPETKFNLEQAKETRVISSRKFLEVGQDTASLRFDSHSILQLQKHGSIEDHLHPERPSKLHFQKPLPEIKDMKEEDASVVVEMDNVSEQI